MRPFLLAALALSLSMPALAEGRYLDRDGVREAMKGPADAAIGAEFRRKSRDCVDVAGNPFKCALDERGISADTTYGQTPTGERVAFVSVRWKSDPRGNAVEHQGFVFAETRRGNYRLVAERPMSGQTIAAVQFSPGRVSVVTEDYRPPNSRTEPSGGTVEVIRYRDPRDAEGT